MKWIPFSQPWLVLDWLNGPFKTHCPEDDETRDELVVTATVPKKYSGLGATPQITKRLWRRNSTFTGDVALYQQSWNNSSFEVVGCLMDKDWNISISGKHFINLILHSPDIEIKKEKLLVVERNHDRFQKTYHDCMVICGVKWTFVKKGSAIFLEAE